MRSEVERYLISHERRLDELESGQLRVSQQLPGLYQRGGQSGGGGAGGFFSDPGSTIVEADSSADLEVMEILTAGDASVGTKTVHNRYSSDTLADARLMLAPCRDGSFYVVNQDYPCPEDA